MENIDQLDKKYFCPICQEIFKKPVIILNCKHIYCSECINSYISSSKNDSSKKFNMKYNCPTCRQEFTLNDVHENIPLINEMNMISVKCKCGKKILLKEYNVHSSKCSATKKELQDCIENRLVKDPKNTVNRETFNCTVCKEKNFDRKGMVNHIKKKHPRTQGVCPICIVQPWGDPNYVTHLQGHMEKRHMFDYDTTVDYNYNEDEVLQRVLMESMNDQ